jgi:O-antigen/teichoic acid export membrane protein
MGTFNVSPPNVIGATRQKIQGQRATSLRINFSWTMLGNLIYTGSQWGILVLLARLGTPADVGEFSLGLATTAPVMLFAGLQLRSVQVTDATRLFDFADYAGLRVLTTLLAVLVIFAVAMVAYRGELALTVCAFAVTKGIEAFSDIVYGFCQQHERMDIVAQSLMLRGVLSLIAVAVTFTAFRNVWLSVCGMAVGWVVTFVAFDLPAALKIAGRRHFLVPRFSPQVLKKLLRMSFPLGVVTMLLSLNANIPRFLIGHERGIRELGAFSALSYALLAGTTIVSALGQSAAPRLAQYSSQGCTREFNRLSNRLIVIGMALGAAGILGAATVGRQVIGMIYGQEYAGYARLFLWLMIASAFTYMASFAGYSLTAARHFCVQMPLFGILTALTLGLCLVLVKANGAIGAAQGLAVVGFVQLAATMTILRRRGAIEAGENL